MAALFLTSSPSGLATQVEWKHENFTEVPLDRIKAEGWQRDFLLKQRDGLTGHMDKICEPFTMEPWTSNREGWEPPFFTRPDGKGGEVVCWEPFEQTGYYYDGVMRAGLLLGDQFLIDKANKQIFGAIEMASPEGVIGADIPDRWAHVPFFRAFMAAYDSTADRKILDALQRHYDNDTFNLAGVRNILNIEQLLWLYRTTGKEAYRDRAVGLYEGQIARGTDRLVNDFKDLVSDERQDVHGCTFHYMLKMPILLYMVTGDTKYLDAARNGFRKLDKFHMLPDGIPATEEGLSDKTSLSARETCNISDFVWTTGHMLRATGEAVWADKIERAVLNAGMAAVTRSFDAHQYFGTLNQVVANIGSSTSPISRPSWNAYCQRQVPACCTGNVHRFFPIYVGLQWLTGRDGALVKPLYGPSQFTHVIGDKSVTIREDSVFPFSDNITLRVVEGTASFPLHLRIPGWAKNPTVEVNGERQDGVRPGEFLILRREFKPGDVVTLAFPSQPRVEPLEMNGVTVSRGPLLFALPIAARTEKVLLNQVMWSSNPRDSKELYGYNMLPDSRWKFVLSLDEAANHGIKVVRNPIRNVDDPWTVDRAPIELLMFGLEMPSWNMLYQEYKPFNSQETRMEPITPPLPPRGAMTMVPRICGKPERITLVPYGATSLRIAVFPYWNIKDTPSFAENQIDYRGLGSE